MLSAALAERNEKHQNINLTQRKDGKLSPEIENAWRQCHSLCTI